MGAFFVLAAEGGSGKSFVANAVKGCATAHGLNVLMLGSTAQAASQLDASGQTVHRAFCLGVPAFLNRKKDKARRRMLSGVDVVLIDEALFMSAELLALVDIGLRRASDTYVQLTKGGVSDQEALR